MQKYFDSDLLNLDNNYSKFKISNSNDDTVFVNKRLIRHLSFKNKIKKSNKNKKG